MSQTNDILSAIGTGFGIPVSDGMINEAHEMLSVATENISASVGDVLSEVGGVVGDVSEVIGDVTDTFGDVTESINEVVGIANDIVSEVMGSLESIWNGIKNLFSGRSVIDQLRDRYQVSSFEHGMAHALAHIGRGTSDFPPPVWDGPSDWVLEFKKAYVAGYYDTLRPILAVLGGRPRTIPGTHAHTWKMYLAVSAANHQEQAQALYGSLSGYGLVEQAQREYAEVLDRRARWMTAAQMIWDRIVLAKQTAADRSGLTLSESVLLSAAPEAYAVMAIY